ncbi:MAG: pilin [Candidatus Paceibacterota bacterium]|jgi:hypothetical protein
MSKKLISSLLLLALFGILSTSLVSAAPIPCGQPGALPCNIVNNPGAPTTVSGAVAIFTKIVQWVYTILFIVAVLFILIAAFYFITSSGDDTKVKKAKSMLLYAVIGIVVALLSWGIVKFVEGSLNKGTGGLL